MADFLKRDELKIYNNDWGYVYAKPAMASRKRWGRCLTIDDGTRYLVLPGENGFPPYHGWQFNAGYNDTSWVTYTPEYRMYLGRANTESGMIDKVSHYVYEQLVMQKLSINL